MDGRVEAQGLKAEAQGLRPKAQEVLSDSQLARDIESAVGIQPSAEFLARVRTRIAADPAAVESGFSRIRQAALEPLWGAAIVGIILAVVVPQWMRDEIDTTPDVVQTAARDVDRTLFPQRSNSVAAAMNARLKDGGQPGFADAARANQQAGVNAPAV